MKNLNKDNHLLTGLVLIGISGVLLALEQFFFEPSDELFTGMFVTHYVLAMVFYIATWHKNGRAFFDLLNRDLLESHVILLLLFNISAYSLNQTLVVFHESTTWLSIFLIIETLLLLSLVFFKELPDRFLHIASFILGIALVFNIYESIVIFPLIPAAFLGAILAGFSLVAFVPVFFVILILRINDELLKGLTHRLWFAGGAVLSLIAALIHLYYWHNINQSFDKIQSGLDRPYADKDLPEWVRIAKESDQHPLLLTFLKTGLVYQNAESLFEGFGGIGELQYTETRIHDPFVVISSALSNKSTLDETTRIKILNYLADSRHQSEQRFWSGENLKTKAVTTNIELFPEEHLAFTELVITIANTRQKSNSRWRKQQEALYTFQLPEGGVVTSLSLWINGQEEKGYLTSKKKAENAYNTIVGKERRDPSVVYWMEGNQVRVRVFPCTPDENRKFKIGVTSPLLSDGKSLKYESIRFKGPESNQAKGQIYIVSKNAGFIDLPACFEYEHGLMSCASDYEPDWSFRIEQPTFKSQTFTYKNENFEITPTVPAFKSFAPEVVYLDLNSNWTIKELDEIANLYDENQVVIYTDHFATYNKELGKRLKPSSADYFTLFPFFEIKNPKNVLIITKGGRATPNLEDLKDSPFYNKLFNDFRKKETPFLVLDLSEKPSDYLRSLHELGVINRKHVTLSELAQFKSQEKYPDPVVPCHKVDIPQSGMSIQKTDSASTQNGSDHLMRLFYYQQVMKEIGNRYFADSKNEYLEDEIVQKAEIANIVTPVSSLIVLETQDDYERFDIKANKDSLGNAAINHTGAVPEPHEWALIILGIVLAAVVYLKSRF